MTKPVFYIAEGPSFSTGEIMLLLLIMAAGFAVFVAVVVIGIQGFHRLGLGRRDSFAVKIAPLIGVVDVLILLSTVRESVPFAIAPLVIHAGAFFVGANKRRNQPPSPPPG